MSNEQNIQLIGKYAYNEQSIYLSYLSSKSMLTKLMEDIHKLKYEEDLKNVIIYKKTYSIVFSF